IAGGFKKSIRVDLLQLLIIDPKQGPPNLPAAWIGPRETAVEVLRPKIPQRAGPDKIRERVVDLAPESTRSVDLRGPQIVLAHLGVDRHFRGVSPQIQGSPEPAFQALVAVVE